MDKELDVLGVFSILLGYENLIENRNQSAQNNVQSANDKQAQYLITELSKKFDEQNEMLKKILSILEDKQNERNQRNGKADP